MSILPKNPSSLRAGEYYFRKLDGTTMRYDRWAMQMWENGPFVGQTFLR